MRTRFLAGFVVVLIGAGAALALLTWRAREPVSRARPPAGWPADLPNYDRPLRALIPSPVDTSRVSLLIEKTKHRLTVLSHGKPVKAYPVVFGRNPVDDKQREGDGCTPEGQFHIAAAHPHRLWSRFMLLDYPTPESWRKFRQAKRLGKIRTNATVGSAVGIHGVPDSHDDLIDSGTNWTLGCISLKTADVEEVYAIAMKGTPVLIVH